MKIKLLTAICGPLLFLLGCQPAKLKSLEAPATILNTLAGTWKLTKVTQTDEDAARKGFPYTVLDLTTTFAYTDFKFTLNLNGTAPGTFATVPGNSPKIIRLTSGNWLVDDPNYPKLITMVNGTDTARITLGSYPLGSNPNLKISSKKSDASGKLLISYSYEFTKQ